MRDKTSLKEKQKIHEKNVEEILEEAEELEAKASATLTEKNQNDLRKSLRFISSSQCHGFKPR